MKRRINIFVSGSTNANISKKYYEAAVELDLSDILVFLKGGSGTLAELFHAIDTKKNGEHKKPILILNIQDEWNDLIRLLEPLKLNSLYEIMYTPVDLI